MLRIKKNTVLSDLTECHLIITEVMKNTAGDAEAFLFNANACR